MRGAPPDLPGTLMSDSPLDRALALLLAGEHEAALRWAAAAVEREAATSSALILTCRILSLMNRTEAAIEGFELGVKRAVDAGNLPLAVAAVADLRQLGRNVDSHLEAIAAAFCKDSPRLMETGAPPPPLPVAEEFQPLSPFLTGPALVSKATEILHEARRVFDSTEEGDDESEPPLISPLPLFSELEKEGLKALISTFQMITVPAGEVVIEEGEEGAEAYIVARGELEVRRMPTSAVDDEDTETTVDATPITLARLTNGALFGEMALLSRAPRAASVVANRASILLVATRDALEIVAEKRGEIAVELAAHCRRRMVANLVRTSPVLLSVEPSERTALVERFETRVFEKGDKLIVEGQEASGLHLIASGEVAVVGHEDGEPVVITTLTAGDTAGEVALVLRRKPNADVVAVHPTVTLYLPKAEFLAIVRTHPAILHGLYLMAVQRDEETAVVLDEAPAAAAEDYVIV